MVLLPYLTLLAALALAVFLLLYGHPLKPYVHLFFIGGALCVCTEGVTGTLLDVYQVRAGLIGDATRDALLACLLTSCLIHPLMAVVFVRLARPRPLLLAIVASVLLGLLEVWFVRTGYMQYRAWHPAASSLFYFAFFWATWNIHSGRLTVPSWAYVLSMAVWLHLNTNLLLHGVLGLWQYAVIMKGDPIEGSHVASNLFVVAVVIPITTVAALVPAQWPRVTGVAGGVLALVIAEALIRATGGVMFLKWNLWLSAARYAFGVSAVSLYGWWLHRGESSMTQTG